MRITYPIKDSDRFTIYDSNTEAPLKNSEGKSLVNQKWASSDKNQMIKGLEPNIKWLQEIKIAKPSFDPATEKVVRNPISYDVADESAIVESWSVVALTQDEIDAKIPPHYLGSQGIMFDISLVAQSAFTSMMTLLEAASFPDNQLVKVKDVYKVEHELTTIDFKTEMVNYGLYCYDLFHAESPADPI